MAVLCSYKGGNWGETFSYVFERVNLSQKLVYILSRSKQGVDVSMLGEESKD